ncbi:MAG: hypothetical protein ACKVHP_16065, partial [Verrucomicrobiales bacterium]
MDSKFGGMRFPMSMVHSSVALLAGCLLLANAGVEGTLPNPFPKLIHVFEEDEGNLKRYYRFPDSQMDHDRLKQFYQDYQAQLSEIPFDALDQEARVDYILFRNYLEHALAQQGHQRKRASEIAEWLAFMPIITNLGTNRRRSEPLDAVATATTLTELQKTLEKVASQLEGDEGMDLDSTLANRVIRFAEKAERDLSEWYAFYDGYDPTFAWWNKAPYQKVNTEFKSYLDLIREHVGDEDTVVGDPIGRRALIEALRQEFITYTPEELIEIAEKEYTWCAREWRRAA